jgi:predicted nuclease of predicted toxin-antitoxin system
MNFLADESVDRHIVETLRNSGHEVIYIADLDPSINDDAVFDRANEIKALLLTADKDFGEIVFRDGRISSKGVILIRLAGLSTDTKGAVVEAAIRKDGLKMNGAFNVITPGTVRIRT